VALFGVGVMSLGWMALIAAFIGAERGCSRGRVQPGGAVALSLLVLGLGVAFFPADLPGFAEPDGAMHGGNGPGESMQMMR
jgi:hypothetical protein